MLRKAWPFLSIAIMLSLTGCTVGRVDTVWPQPRPLGRDIAVFHPPRDVSSDDRTDLKIEEPDGDITLRQALSLALMKNPELAAFSWEVRAREARTLQAGLLYNPELEFEVEEFGGSGEKTDFDAAAFALSLSQTIELGGKRSKRARVAEIEQDIAGWDYEAKRLDVFTKTAQRSTEVIAAQRRLELAKSAVVLAEQTSQAVGERVNAGKEPPVQATKAVAELEMARLGALEAEDSLAVSRKKLAAMWGVEQPHFQKVVGDFDSVLDALPSLEMLRLRLSSNPALARGDAELKLRQAALASEQAARVPDLEATIGLQSFEEDGSDAMAFGIGVPLPLFDRNQGGIAAAKHELAKTRAERRAVETELAAELAEIHARLTSSHRRAMTLRSKVVPAMKEAFDAAHKGYEQGKFGFLDVLDAQRGLFAVRGNLLDALSDYHVALADIQKITGTSIEELLENKVEETK